jgi:hypothetical protein
MRLEIRSGNFHYSSVSDKTAAGYFNFTATKDVDVCLIYLTTLHQMWAQQVITWNKRINVNVVCGLLYDTVTMSRLLYNTEMKLERICKKAVAA